MIIDSTTIGMESARTFRSDSREARFTCITDSAGIMPDFTGMVLQKGGRAEWNAGGRTGTAGLNGPDAAGQTGSMQAPSPPGTVDEPRSASEMLRDIFDTMQVKNTPQMRRLMEENTRKADASYSSAGTVQMLWARIAASAVVFR